MDNNVRSSAGSRMDFVEGIPEAVMRSTVKAGLKERSVLPGLEVQAVFSNSAGSKASRAASTGGLPKAVLAGSETSHSECSNSVAPKAAPTGSEHASGSVVPSTAQPGLAEVLLSRGRDDLHSAISGHSTSTVPRHSPGGSCYYGAAASGPSSTMADASRLITSATNTSHNPVGSAQIPSGEISRDASVIVGLRLS